MGVINSENLAKSKIILKPSYFRFHYVLLLKIFQSDKINSCQIIKFLPLAKNPLLGKKINIFK